MSRLIDLGNNVSAAVEDGTCIRLRTTAAVPAQTIYFDRTSAEALHNVLRAFLGKQQAASGLETSARHSCHCPAGPGNDCQLTTVECKHRALNNAQHCEVCSTVPTGDNR